VKRAVALAVALLAAGACGSNPETLDVFAASSLTEVLPRIDGSARYQFAGSDDLALQIREGAEPDVFAAASPRYPMELYEEGLVEEPVVFATNRLVLIVPRDNPADISSVEDLASPGVKLVVGAEGVPVGDYTRQVLAKLGAGDAFDSVVSEEGDVKGIVGKVAFGEADAGFVYATDVEPVQEDVVAIELPPRGQPTVQYMAAVVADGDRTAAEGFIDLLLGEDGRRVLSSAGFGLP
jgi:molybdate transport system substrate-binding protein